MLNVVDDDVTTKLCVNGEPSSFFLKYYGVLTLPFPVQPVCLGGCHRSSPSDMIGEYKLPLCVFTWSRIHIQFKPQVQNANYSDRDNERRSQKCSPSSPPIKTQSEAMSSNLILNGRNTLRATVNTKNGQVVKPLDTRLKCRLLYCCRCRFFCRFMFFLFGRV